MVQKCLRDAPLPLGRSRAQRETATMIETTSQDRNEAHRFIRTSQSRLPSRLWLPSKGSIHNAEPLQLARAAPVKHSTLDRPWFSQQHLLDSVPGDPPNIRMVHPHKRSRRLPEINAGS